MRIALLTALLLIVGYELTVVTTAAGAGGRGGGNKQQRARHQDHQQMYRNQTSGTSSDTFGRWLPVGEAQTLLRRESSAGAPVDCCPSIVEMVEPEGGKNMEGMYVELYRDGHNRQRFYEVSCRPDVENKPCRFIERRLHNQSRCIQKFSYTYALVRDAGTSGTRQFSGPASGGSGSWTMDYIEVRSGCSCMLHARARHRHARPAHKHRQQSTSERPTEIIP